MRELILKMSMSIDGFVSGPNGEADWMFRNADARSTAWTLDSVSHAGVHIMGAKTFVAMAAHWPSSTHVFAAPMNDIPKVVFARHGRPDIVRGTATADGFASWQHARVASGELGDEIARLKQEPGGPIIAHGGASFAQSLARSGLVDEYRLLVHPVALGRGLPVFSALDAPLALQLVELVRFDTGVVAHVLRKR
ncbi:MAG TPA: dihydrofolate reductase family protein [Kofleriaceae bacterium]|jgi:dihydrofolate reductase